MLEHQCPGTKFFTCQLHSTCVMKSYAHLHLLFCFVKYRMSGRSLSWCYNHCSKDYSKSFAHNMHFCCFKHNSCRASLVYHTWKMWESSESSCIEQQYPEKNFSNMLKTTSVCMQEVTTNVNNSFHRWYM